MSYHTDYCKYLNYHGLGIFEPLIEMFLKSHYSNADKILVPSNFTLKQLESKGYENIDIWSRGIDIERFSPKFKCEETRKKLGIEDKFSFLYVGRLSAEKNLNMLIYAAERMEKLYPGKTAFVITGDGPYADTILQANLNNVVMTGFKHGEELSKIYASCDCFATPSGTETFGNTGLEALASGLPVLGVKSGGVTEYLTDGENSLLCEDGDNESFANQFVEIYKNRELLNTLSEKGLLTAKGRSWDSIFDNLLKVYQREIRKNTLQQIEI